MYEKCYEFHHSEDYLVEKIIQDEDVHVNHMIFKQHEGLPTHKSNSSVYMIVIRGILSLKLEEQDFHEYSSGCIVNIPFGLRMDVNNLHEETLELFVLKAPSPEKWKENHQE